MRDIALYKRPLGGNKGKGQIRKINQSQQRCAMQKNAKKVVHCG